jgi:hypothetical protein
MIRDDLYSLTLLDRADGAPAFFHLGEPIVLEFLAVRETLKANDWVGLYGVTHNPDQSLTTAQCGDKWTYVSGPNPPGWSPSCEELQKLYSLTNVSRTFGTSPVEVFQCPRESGLRLVKGRLTFSGSSLPWKVGVYEARYHFAGKYACIAISRPFEIVPIVVDDGSGLGRFPSGYVSPALDAHPSEALLTRIITACLDMAPGTQLGSRQDFFLQSQIPSGTLCCLAL